MVLLDGNEQKGIPFVKALTALRSEAAATAHCLRAETYYPTALLADLTATYLARKIDSGEYDYDDPLLRAPLASQIREEWGKASSGLYERDHDGCPGVLALLEKVLVDTAKSREPRDFPDDDVLVLAGSDCLDALGELFATGISTRLNPRVMRVFL